MACCQSIPYFRQQRKGNLNGLSASIDTAFSCFHLASILILPPLACKKLIFEKIGSDKSTSLAVIKLNALNIYR